MEGMTDEQKIVHLLDRLVADVNMIKLVMLLFLVMSIIGGLVLAQGG